MQGSKTDNIISTAAADRLIAAHDGDLALLYLFIQRTGSRDLEQAADRLCRTLREMQAAYEKLERMGLVSEGDSCDLTMRQVQEKKFAPTNELPEYTAADIVARTQGDSAFAALVHEARQILGKHLSTPDLRKIYAIYDYFGLPAEVIMMLMNFCKEISKDNAPTMRFIEKQAEIWTNQEILTLEQAEEYIGLYKQRREATGKVAELLGIRGRQLSATEKKHIGAWLDMGFGPEAIELAYDRTVTNTGGLKWNYMNKILESWKERGLFDVVEIEEKDSRRRPIPQQNNGGSIDFSGLDKMFNEI